MKEENDMEIWFYLSGVIVSIVVVLISCLHDWYCGIDIRLGELLKAIVSTLGSWFTVIYVIVMALWELFQEHYGDIVIKGKNNDI